MITENLTGLNVHKLTQEQYDRELEAGRIDENAIYLTPAEELDLSMYPLSSEIEGIYETKENVLNMLNESDRFSFKLKPEGTELVASEDAPINLNSVEYLKVGNYYCKTDAAAKNITNSPSSSIFLMRVYSPGLTTVDNETTQKYCYRVRQLINRSGAEYTQVCSTGSTAN
jgi:hypothetical protein